MTLLNTANRIYLGPRIADAVYAGAAKVWPPTNFATFDPGSSINVSFAANFLRVTNTSTGTYPQGARVAGGKTAGKFYFETTLTLWATGGSVGIGGVGVVGTAFNDMQNGATGGVMLQSSAGQIWANYTVPANLGGRATGDRFGFAINIDDRRFHCRLVAPTTGDWNGSVGNSPLTPSTGIALPDGELTPYCTFGGASTGPGNTVTADFGDTSFFGAVPSGFVPGWPP